MVRKRGILIKDKKCVKLEGRVLDFITEQTKDLEQIALGNTEIIESAFGKTKQLMDENSKEGFTLCLD